MTDYQAVRTRQILDARLASNLALLRRATGEGYRDLSKRTGIGYTSICELERGQGHFGKKRTEVIASAFGLTGEQFSTQRVRSVTVRMRHDQIGDILDIEMEPWE